MKANKTIENFYESLSRVSNKKSDNSLEYFHEESVFHNYFNINEY